jgi:cytochrome b involved in lipid metabolism
MVHVLSIKEDNIWSFYKDGVYVKIEGFWFDLTNYNTHPGGSKILKKFHCKDATKFFNNTKGHNDAFVESMLKKYEITNIFLIKYLELMEQK